MAYQIVDEICVAGVDILIKEEIIDNEDNPETVQTICPEENNDDYQIDMATSCTKFQDNSTRILQDRKHENNKGRTDDGADLDGFVVKQEYIPKQLDVGTGMDVGESIKIDEDSLSSLTETVGNSPVEECVVVKQEDLNDDVENDGLVENMVRRNISMDERIWQGKDINGKTDEAMDMDTVIYEQLLQNIVIEKNLHKDESDESTDINNESETFDTDTVEKEYRASTPKEDDSPNSKGKKKGKEYVCEFCNRVFLQLSRLQNHKVIHTGETPYRCHLCKKGFNVRSNLNVHLRIHTGSKPHVCEYCNKSFRQAGQLKQHNRVHNGEKPYNCTHCARMFRSSSSLVTHLRTHTGEKPFQCSVCDRSFSTTTSMKTHMVTHSGQMLYDCPLCEKKFNRKNNLNVHIKRHDKHRRFSCQICRRGFVMRAHLLRHLRCTHDVAAPEDEETKVFGDLEGSGSEKPMSSIQ